MPVAVHGGRGRAPATRRPGGLRPVIVAGGLLLALLAGLAVRNTGQSDRADEARVAGALRWTVLSGTMDPGTRGTAGSLLQRGVVDLTLRNDSPVTVHLLSARLDGADPVSAGSPAPVRPGATAVLPVTWQVRCAEVGVVPGPRLLELRVRLRSATSYAVQVPLTGPATDRAFHLAADTACDVLVRHEQLGR